MEPKVLEEVEQYCDYFINPYLGEPIAMTSLGMATNNVISTMIFGGRSDYADKRFQNLTHHVDQYILSTLPSGILRNVPFARLLKISKIKDMEESSHAIQQEMDARFESSKASYNPSSVHDMFGHFIQYQKTHSHLGNTVSFRGKTCMSFRW